MIYRWIAECQDISRSLKQASERNQLTFSVHISIDDEQSTQIMTPPQKIVNLKDASLKDCKRNGRRKRQVTA